MATTTRLPVSIALAQQMAVHGAPWRIRMIYQEGTSNKFWEAVGKGRFDVVTISWGRIGSIGQSCDQNLAYLLKTGPQKLKKGYVYAGNTIHTPPPLAFPFNQIRWAYQTTWGEWHCRDAKGGDVVRLTEQGGHDLMIYAQPGIVAGKVSELNPSPFT